MDKEAQKKMATRPHYCTHYFREGNNKFRGKYLYWGRCWCGYKASAYGRQLVECKMHGHTETMELGYRKLPKDRPELREKIEGILEAWEEEGKEYILRFSYGGIAYEILALIPDKLPKGKPPHE